MTSAVATLPETLAAVESNDAHRLDDNEAESPVRVSPRGLQMLAILNGLLDEQAPETARD